MKNEADLLKKSIKLVALDLDGTTFDSAGDISERTVAALEDAARLGVHIVVSTGRSYASLPKHIKDVSGIEYAITSNGAHVNLMHTGEQIYSDFLDPEAVGEIAAIKEETAADEPSVIISRRPCALLKYVKHNAPLIVEEEKCKSCKMCMKIGCPAISMADGKAKIDNTLCTGCGVCEQLCKFDALHAVKEG